LSELVDLRNSIDKYLESGNAEKSTKSAERDLINIKCDIIDSLGGYISRRKFYDHFKQYLENFSEEYPLRIDESLQSVERIKNIILKGNLTDWLKKLVREQWKNNISSGSIKRAGLFAGGSDMTRGSAGEFLSSVIKSKYFLELLRGDIGLSVKEMIPYRTDEISDIGLFRGVLSAEVRILRDKGHQEKRTILFIRDS
jgi:hypothetical protein